jgi:hypothetical protein
VTRFLQNSIASQEETNNSEVDRISEKQFRVMMIRMNNEVKADMEKNRSEF